MSGISYFSARGVALLACLSAVYVAVALVVPGVPVIGASEGKISMSATLAPIYGFMLGPYFGALVVLFANFVAWIIPPTGLFGMFTIFSPVLSAFIAGALTKRSRGWALAAIPLVLLILAWYGTWVGQAALYIPALHFVALAIIIILRKRLANWFWNGKRWLGITIPLCSYAGFMADHMFGSLVFIGLAPLLFEDAVPALPAIFMAVFPVSIAERLFMTVVASIIGPGVIVALRARQFMFRAES